MKLPPLKETVMSITLPAELLQTAQMTEAEMLREIAIMLYQQQRIELEQAAQLTGIPINDFYQLLVSRNIITPPTELLETLKVIQLGLEQIQQGKGKKAEEFFNEFFDKLDSSPFIAIS